MRCVPGYRRIVRTNASTASDLWFEAYLEQEGITGADDPEPDLGVSTRPDYLIARGGAQAVCEVKEFTTSGLMRRTSGPHNRVLTLSDGEVYGGIRKQVGKAAGQLRPLRDRNVPLVVVLANANGVPMELDADAVQAALYGNPTFGGPVYPATGAIVDFGRIPGRDGRLTNQHEFISAVVVLHRRPLSADARDAFWWYWRPILRHRYPDREDYGIAIATFSQLAPTGPDGYRYFVEVMHTVSAMDGRAPLLDPQLFDGQHDRVYEPDRQGFYARVS